MSFLSKKIKDKNLLCGEEIIGKIKAPCVKENKTSDGESDKTFFMYAFHGNFQIISFELPKSFQNLERYQSSTGN